MRQVLHNVAQVPQPSPGISEGGDCFACAGLTIARHFFPEAADLSVADAVQWFDDTYYNSDKHFTNNTISYAPSAFGESPFSFEVHTDPFAPVLYMGSQPFWPVWWPESFEERVEAYLSAGWLGFAGMSFEPHEFGLGEPIPDKPHHHWKHSTDHMVVIDGYRSYWLRDHTESAAVGTFEHDLHVMCSVKGGYWIGAKDWLALHGGMFIWWVRPKEETWHDEVPA